MRAISWRSGTPALPGRSRLVERHGRVLRGPDILGTLLVEAPAEEIPALAEHEAVDALVEDREVGPSGPRR